MAVEIRELVIRAVIKDEQNSSEETGTETGEHDMQGRDAIIEACVKQVLKILNRKQER
ncbi:DUF5908 family protein [Methylobacter sp. Wu8]|jgi:hypothetical protein|uniref:Uncharacterized protein n=1 Tax=Methylobacter tundripaludum TaxID=173365 RepID=A0A2S6GLC2_9GAMM|nr:DUF5908 family protein [Methylobacter tundripaludum]MCF7967132.1 DUF5908 family protein [Methylobacter tundripaludum]MCK9636288.1 DUF5908 family protein [Methylobacter tundripaludum]PPK65990.1 hypothetical protein B0F88_11822 [Methylobacter tundripaludum]